MPETAMTQAGKFKAACIQMKSAKEPAANIARVEALVREAAAAGAELIMTPEMSNAIDRPKEALAARLSTQDSCPAVASFKALVRETGKFLLAGSVGVKTDNGMLANRSLLFSPQGQILAKYDKAHMFDVDLPNGESYRESGTFEAGSEIVTADLPWGRLGLSICYDMRFAYMYRTMAQAGCSFITVPASFTVPTGRAHWHVLLRARAIETGCFVFAPAQCGTHEDGRKTYGHSIIVSPWGDVLADAGEAEEAVIVSEIDTSLVTEARRRIPALTHDRDLVYSGGDSKEAAQ